MILCNCDYSEVKAPNMSSNLSSHFIPSMATAKPPTGKLAGEAERRPVLQPENLSSNLISNPSSNGALDK